VNGLNVVTRRHYYLQRAYHPAQRTQREGRNAVTSLLDRPIIAAASDDGVCRWHAAKLWQTRHKIWNYWK